MPNASAPPAVVEMTRPPSIAAAIARSLRSVVVLGTTAIVLAVGVFYFWTAATSPDPGRSYHSLLAESFEHGRTDLPVTPAPELLALPDPYDPAQNLPYRLHDASLYHGNYYLYFGPAPAALFFLPLRIVGVEATDRWVDPALALGAFAASAALLLFLIARYLPRTPTVWRLVAVAGLGLGNMVPFMLRRPEVYETSIAAGLLFLMLAALLAVVGTLRERPSLPLIALGSLSLGLAVGSRANMVLAAPLLVWAWWRVLGPRAGWRWRRVARVAVAAGGPFAACLLLLALYNVVRFGSPTELGVTYQLASQANAHEFDYFELGRLLPGAWFYVLQPPDIGLDFPFITLNPEYPGTLPTGFFVEPVAGVLVVAPLVAVLLALPWLARNPDAKTRELAGFVGLLAIISLLLPLPSLVGFGGATERYEVDFASFLIIGASLTWLWLADRGRRRRSPRWAVLGVGTAAILFCVTTNLAFSVVGYSDGLRVSQLATYARIERAFAWIPTLAATIRGEPVLLETGPREAILRTATVQIAAPGSGVVALRARFLTNPDIPRGSRIVIQVRSLGGTSDPIELAGGETTVRAEVSHGLNNLLVVWTVIGYAGPVPATGVPPPGLGIREAQVVAWDPGGKTTPASTMGGA
jgi:hypothetical protein